MNNIVMVGKIKTMPNDNNIMVVGVTRNFKDEHGEYLTDYVPVKIWNDNINNIIEYCKIDDIIGIKGRIQSEDDTNNVYVVAERMTFLSSGKKEDK